MKNFVQNFPLFLKTCRLECDFQQNLSVQVLNILIQNKVSLSENSPLNGIKHSLNPHPLNLWAIFLLKVLFGRREIVTVK